MEVTYRRDKDHNYMILEPPGDVSGSEFPVRMLMQNQIPGLLSCKMRKIDQRTGFYYEITSLQPMSGIFEKKRMGTEDIRQLLNGVSRALEGAREFLLDEKQFLLEPEYIYMDAESLETYLCCLPLHDEDIQGAFQRLAEYILKKLDHEDPEAVLWGYEIYSRTMEENYSVQSVLETDREHRGIRGSERSGHGPEKGVRGSERDGRGPEKDARGSERGGRGSGKGARGSERGGHGSEKGAPSSGKSGHASESEFYSSENEKPEADEMRSSKEGCGSPALEEPVPARSGRTKSEKKGRNKAEEKAEPAKEREGARSLPLRAASCAAGALGVAGVSWGISQIAGLSVMETGGIFFLGIGLFFYFTCVWKGFPKRERLPKMPPGYEADALIWEEEEDQNRFPEGADFDEASEEKHGEESSDRSFYREYEEESEEEFGATTLLQTNQVKDYAALVSMEKEKRENIVLDRDVLIVGKLRGQADVILNEPVISRIHAKVERRTEGYYLTDQNSMNGTYVNGMRLEAYESRRLETADEVYFASLGYYFKG